MGKGKWIYTSWFKLSCLEIGVSISCSSLFPASWEDSGVGGRGRREAAILTAWGAFLAPNRFSETMPGGERSTGLPVRASGPWRGMCLLPIARMHREHLKKHDFSLFPWPTMSAGSRAYPSSSLRPGMTSWRKEGRGLGCLQAHLRLPTSFAGFKPGVMPPTLL